ncbi:MAG: serine/threonine-protein phosphatase [Oscillospiraceae bacterium]|jgi:protein phosphatase|nr:serine/threonine-protein phosphatase [Oscillospiraceae bacterium]
MKNGISFVVLCDRGTVRHTNQDNFWCKGQWLVSNNNGLEKKLAGTVPAASMPAFAVFDGVGGEQYGEIAAFIAAKTFDASPYDSSENSLESHLLNVCREMNREICAFSDEQSVRQMGTTAAIIQFGGDKLTVCNVGDSKIFRFSGRVMTQLSLDHVVSGVFDKKPPLSQCLGIPESEFLIEPYIRSIDYNAGDKFLLCSDGLTDMVSDDFIESVLSADVPLAAQAKHLMTSALANGGVDNTTIILCEVRPRKRLFQN